VIPPAGRVEAGIWNRPYVLSLLANFLIFYVVTSFVLYPLLIKESGGSDTQVGLIMGVFSVVAVLLRPITGMAAERLGYRTVTIFGLATMTATVPFFAMAEPTGTGVVLLRVFFGDLSEALGIYGISGLTAHALSPMISELIVAKSSYQVLFITDGLLALAAIGLVAAVPSSRRLPPAPESPEPPRSAGHLLRTAIAGVVLVAVAHGAVRGTNLNFIAPYCRDIGIERFFPFFVAFSIAAILTRFKLAALPDRFGRRRVAIPALLLVAGNSLVISQINATWLLVIAGLLGGLGQGLIFPSLSSLMVDLIGHHRRAFALSVYTTCFEIGFGLGLPVFGMVADHLGYRLMYVASGVYLFITILLFIRLVPPDRK